MRGSIQQNLLSGLTVAIVLICLVAGGLAFVVSVNRAQSLQDDTLRLLASLVDADDIGPTGRIVVTSNDFIQNQSAVIMVPALASKSSPLHPPANPPLGFSTFKVKDADWRLYVRRADDGNLIAAAQPSRERIGVALQAAVLTILPLLVLIPVLAWLSRRIVRRQMAPLHDLAPAFSDHMSGVAPLLPEANVPEEALPFVRSLNTMLARINRMIDEQQRFVADAAHELRSPLAALSLQADNLANANTPEKMQERLLALREGIQRANRMTVQLLELARERVLVITVAPADVTMLARSVVTSLLPLIEARHIEISLEPAEHLLVNTNAELFTMLLRNAVDNAIRHGPTGGEVSIRLAVDGQEFVAIVTDTGPGIPDADRERVFEPFRRLAGARTEGSGLGLAIVRDAAARLGGKVTLRNRSDRSGLEFTYRQPLERD